MSNKTEEIKLDHNCKVAISTNMILPKRFENDVAIYEYTHTKNSIAHYDVFIKGKIQTLALKIDFKL